MLIKFFLCFYPPFSTGSKRGNIRQSVLSGKIKYSSGQFSLPEKENQAIFATQLHIKEKKRETADFYFGNFGFNRLLHRPGNNSNDHKTVPFYHRGSCG
jgi:hypothetical protein